MANPDWEKFEATGEEGVREDIAAGRYLKGRAQSARDWIAYKELQRAEGFNREQISVARDAAAAARDAADEARTANKIAKAAIAIAIVSIVVTIASLFVG
jgi:hypothetical protein